MKCPTGQRLHLQLFFLVLLTIGIPASALCHRPSLSLKPSSVDAPPEEALPAGVTADQLLRFADQLMDEGEYFRAITEYRRFLFFHPEDARRPMAHFRIGLAFYRGQSYEEALRTFSDVIQQYPETSYGQQAWLWQGEILIQQGHYAIAEQLYTDINRRFPMAPIGQQALYQQGWTLLYRRRWHEASALFRQIAPLSPLYSRAQQLAEDVLKGETLASKSPLVAGLLSGILPGSGQLYNGRPGDALLAFLLNGLFIAGIVQSTRNDAPIVAGVLSFFEAGWYAGNVYSAINGSHKFNRHNTESFIRNLESQYRLILPEVQQRSSAGIRFSLGF